jgi:NADP-dependent aldehyde dehydrogenase
MESLGDTLVKCCSEETSLPAVRCGGERDRTTGQLRMFSKLLREGSWLQARLDVDPTKGPLGDLRNMMVPIGPVGVFAASNFPLAFSAAGGDTASALAAGCPVVMKAHSAHPKTCELVGMCIMRAAKANAMPEGVYSMVYGRIGVQLVEHPHIKAIGFTGSYGGGRMFADIAAKRPEPIPVFAEMGSINPVFVLPDAIRGDAAVSVATTLAASIVQGAGQFCTNPGSIFVVDSPDAQRFVKTLAEKIAATPTAPMLTPGIRDAYRSAVDTMAKHGANIVASGAGTDPARPTLLSAPASALLKSSDLAEEAFGPSSMVFLGASSDELMSALAKLGGQLTATIWATDADLAAHPEVVPALAAKVGRLIFNGVPTGVAVCDAMQHGGPFPAASDSRFTSVGTGAIDRFVRPVCFQSMPAKLQPAELRDENPLGIMRVVNGVRSRGSLADVTNPKSKL